MGKGKPQASEKKRSREERVQDVEAKLVGHVFEFHQACKKKAQDLGNLSNYLQAVLADIDASEQENRSPTNHP